MMFPRKTFKIISTICNKYYNDSKEINLKPSKCKFLQKQVRFHGNTVTVEGYKADPSLTKPITKFVGDPPRDITGVDRFLGLLGYFRRHIQSLRSVARPLYDLIKLVSSNKLVVNKSLIEYGEKHQVALEKLISAVTNPPVLTYPDFI